MGYEEIEAEMDVELGEVSLFTTAEEADKWETLFNGGVSNLTLDDQYKKFIYDRVFGLVNIAHNALTQKGYFYAPFFVRFALRMYDGSHIMHTPPQLMIAGAAGKPLLGVKETNLRYPYLSPLFCASRLCADIKLFDCDKWGDLITHLDVFVSAPIVSYTDSVEAIKSIGIANIPYYEGDENVGAQIKTGSMPQYDTLYAKDRYEVGNLYDDFYKNGRLRGFKLQYKSLRLSKDHQHGCQHGSH